MAVQPRISRIRFGQNPGGNDWREIIATAAVQDTPAGGSVVITITQTAGTGLVAPQTPDSLTLRVYIDNQSMGGTTGAVRSFTLAPGSGSQTATLHLTEFGASGEAARAGTLRLQVHAVKTTGGPTNTYNVNSDNTTGESLPVGWSAVRDQGWIRGSTSSTTTLSNVALGGAKTQPAIYNGSGGESIFSRTVLGATLYLARTITVALSDGGLSSTSAAQTSGNFDLTWANVVDNRFPAALTTVSTTTTIQNATLTGQPATALTKTEDSIQVDPRLWVEHLLQLNSTYFSPPLADPNITDEVVFPVIGYIGTNLRSARGTKTGTTITGGQNSIDHEFDFVAQATAQNFPGTGYVSANRGGEDGWQDNLYIWSSATAGEWVKTVKVNEADLTNAYLVNREVSYTLIALDPNLGCSVIVGTNDPNNHFLPGALLEVDVKLVDGSLRKGVEPEETSVVFRRVNSQDRAQYLGTDGTWHDSFDGTVPPVPVVADRHLPSQLSPDQLIYRLTLQTDATWTNDFEVVGLAKKGGVNYRQTVQKEVVGTYHRHGSPEPGGAVGIDWTEHISAQEVLS